MDWTTPHTTYEPTILQKDWVSLCNAKPSTLVSAHHRQGMKIIEHYQPGFWKVESPKGESILKHWNNPTSRAIAEERVRKHYTTLYKSEVRRNLAFYTGAPLPTVYRPLLVKGIVSHYNAKQVLDPTIGWGGRVLGTLAVKDTHFTGCEPNTETFNGLQQMTEFIKQRATIYHDDCLKVLPTLQSNFYDLVLTSPPYFNLEVYSHEPTQSTVQFPNWDDWVKHFLEPMITQCLRCLTVDGKSAWSVKNMPKCKLKDEVFRIHTKHGWTLLDTFGMTATPRNTGKKATITEETFVFSRTKQI